MLNSISLSWINSGFFHFRPDHFTIVFLDILNIRMVNLRWLSVSLWFHHLTIPIHLLQFWLLLCFELLFHCRSQPQSSKSKVEQERSWFSVVLSIEDSWNSTSELFRTLQQESARIYILWRKQTPPLFHFLFSRKSRHALTNFAGFPAIAFITQQYGSILIESLLFSLSIVTFSIAFTFSQLTFL